MCSSPTDGEGASKHLLTRIHTLLNVGICETGKHRKATESLRINKERARLLACWSATSAVNTMLRMPSVAGTEPGGIRRGSNFQKKVTPEAISVIKDPTSRVEQSKKLGFPLHKRAHISQDVMEA